MLQKNPVSFTWADRDQELIYLRKLVNRYRKYASKKLREKVKDED